MATTELVRPEKFSLSQIKVYYDHRSELIKETVHQELTE